MSYWISLVGGGGKTTTMMELANLYARENKSVIVTTTTHIFRPEVDTFLTDEKEFKKVLRCGEIVCVAKSEKNGKLDGIVDVERLDGLADIIIVEADGAKRLPIKLPREHEPVIPSLTDEVYICVGIDALGKRICDTMFCYELAVEHYGWSAQHILSAEDIATIMTDLKGLRKGCQGLKITFVINKADNDDLAEIAGEISKIIAAKMHGDDSYRVKITGYRNFERWTYV